MSEFAEQPSSTSGTRRLDVESLPRERGSAIKRRSQAAPTQAKAKARTRDSLQAFAS